MKAFIAFALILLFSVGIVVQRKQISPLSWGLYGQVYAPNGLAINGYDPVNYRLAGSAALGHEDITSQWQGATWRFVSKENKARFDTDPALNAPAFGGFCSYAVSKGFTAKCDNQVWRIEGGRLYLFNDRSMRDHWIAGLPEVIAQDEAHWAKRPQEEKQENPGTFKDGGAKARSLK